MRLLVNADNLLLRAAYRDRLPVGELKHVLFESGEQLWGSSEPLSYVLFPVRGVISLQVSAGTKQAGIGLLGREGCVEITAFLGGSQTRVTAVALTSGEALAMKAEFFARHLDNTLFRAALEQYTRTLLVMFNQIAACNRLHAFEKTLIGRLLLIQDRTSAESLQVTQDFLSRLLGVRKATVSRAASALQKQGAIAYDRRGRLTILDRKKLERHACSCYRVIKRESDELIAALGGL